MASEARSCGECTVCCTALVVDSPEFRKPSGVTCSHCTSNGCAIYPTRYPICREYSCGWKHLPELDASWRPDRSGVVVTPQRDNIPAEFALREGIEFLVLTGTDALTRQFADAVLAAVRNGLAAFLAVPGPKGHYPARALLNRPLAQAAASADPRGAIVILAQMLKAA